MTAVTKKNAAKPKTQERRKLSRGELRRLGAVEKQFEQLWAQAQKDNLYAKYALAEFIRSTVSTYGDEGVVRLAKKVGRSKSLFYVYLRILELFDRGLLRSLIAKAGGRLEWSHLYILAEQKRMTEERRDALLDQVVKEKLSARALKRKLGDAATDETEDELHEEHEAATTSVSTSRTEAPFRPLGGLKGFDRAAQAVIGRFEEVDRAFEEIEQLPDDQLNAKLVEQLKADVKTIERLQYALPRLAEKASRVLSVVQVKVKPEPVVPTTEAFTVSPATNPPVLLHVGIAGQSFGRVVDVESDPAGEEGI